MSDADLDFLRQIAERQQAPRRQDVRSRGGGRRGRGRRRKRSRKGRVVAPFLAIVFLATVVGGGGFFGYTVLNGYLNPPDYPGQGSGEVTVQIRDGDSVKLMGQRLHEAQVVKSADAFVKVAKDEPKATSIQPGFYRLRAHMSARSVLALLLNPASLAGNRITIPEGRRVPEVLRMLAKKTGIPLRNFQRAAKNPTALGLPAYARGNIEGYLFPFTYDLNPNGTAAEILRTMVTRYKKSVEEFDLEAAARRVRMTPREVVIVASLVQAESGRAGDMPKVARVIYNRLHDDRQPWMKKLQLDSTVMYGLGKYGIVATGTDIQSATPYNTYRFPGLPPGPIANPGQAALRAALHPAAGRWEFFVTTDPKRRITKFTASHDQFLRYRKELIHNTGGG